MSSVSFAPVLLLVAGLGLVACEQVQEARNTYNAVTSTARAAKNLDATVHATEQKRSDRAARGDTLSLDYKELQRYLPASVNGFTAVGAPTGESVNLSGVSYSTCEQAYEKNGQHLKIQLVDYNGANALYAGATAMMSAGFSQENDEQLMRGCELGVPGVKGWETLQKKEGKASVALGVGGRFFLAVESDGQRDTELVKQVARNLNLDALAKL